MPVSFLSEEQDRKYGRYAEEPSPEQMARFFHLDDADRDLIRKRRGDHMRLGLAIQIGNVRFLGTFLEDITGVPPVVVKFLARQLDIADPACLSEYCKSERRWQHANEIREHYGYHIFSEPGIQWRLARWLYALCWTGTDRPSVLFDRAVAWLVAGKVLLPGASVLERLIAQVRSRANQRLWRRLTAGITPQQQERLESLLVVPEGSRQSPFDRLRHGPTLQSVPELGRAIARLEEVQSLAHGLPRTEELPRTRVQQLARHANTADAQTLARLTEQRRCATLLAFITTLEATATDDVLDLFDIVMTRMVNEAQKLRQQMRLRGVRDLDAAAIILRKAWAIAMTTHAKGSDGIVAALAAVPQDAIEEAITRIDDLTRAADDPYFDEIITMHRRVQQFLPALAKTVPFGANPAAQPLLTAIRHLRVADKKGKSRVSLPVEFVPKAWRSRVQQEENTDRQAWAMCLVHGMRSALRKRSLFAAPSQRYDDPRIGLLAGAAWEAARPAVCRSLGLSPSADEEIAKLSTQLDASYRQVSAGLPHNRHVRIEPDGKLVLTGLDAIEEPQSLKDLRQEVGNRLPRVDLPEILLEIHARTGFADAFTHVSEAEARADDLALSVCAVLLAEATNTIAPLPPELGAAELSSRRHADQGQRQACRGSGRHRSRPTLGRR
jgi:hypothetical protein